MHILNYLLYILREWQKVTHRHLMFNGLLVPSNCNYNMLSRSKLTPISVPSLKNSDSHLNGNMTVTAEKILSARGTKFPKYS